MASWGGSQSDQAGFQTSQSRSASGPWSAMQPYLQNVWQQATNLGARDEGYFPGTTIGGRSAATRLAQGAGVDLARGAGGPAMDYIRRTLSPEFMNVENNPYLRQVNQAASDDITRNYLRAVAPSTSLGVHGRSMSGREFNRESAARRDLAQELSQMTSGLYSDAYARNQGLQAQAAGMAPGIEGSRRADLTTALQLGLSEDEYTQSLVNDAVSRYNYERDNPWAQLQKMTQAIFGGGVVQESESDATSRGVQVGGSEGHQGGILTSSRAMKTKLGDIDHREVMRQVRGLDDDVWEYNEKTPPEMQGQVHVGPYAEEFQEAFGLGDGKTIHFIDVAGIALSAVKGLAAQVDELRGEVAQLKSALEMHPVPVEG